MCFLDVQRPSRAGLNLTDFSIGTSLYFFSCPSFKNSRSDSLGLGPARGATASPSPIRLAQGFWAEVPGSCSPFVSLTRSQGTQPVCEHRALLRPPWTVMENRHLVTEGHLSSCCGTSSDGAAAVSRAARRVPRAWGGPGPSRRRMIGRRWDPAARSNQDGSFLGCRRGPHP